MKLDYREGIIFIASSAGYHILDRVWGVFETKFPNVFPNFSIADLIFTIIGIFGVYLVITKRTVEKTKYEPNPQNYWEHVKKLHGSLEEDLIKETGIKQNLNITTDSGLPNLYEIIKNSPKKQEMLQHMATTFSHKNERIPSVFWSFTEIMIVEETIHEPRLKDEFVKKFNEKFNHVFQIMGDSKPLVGLCDGCKMDYYGDDKERCLQTLDNFNREFENLMKKVFENKD